MLIRWNKLIFVIAELLQETEERRDGWFFWKMSYVGISQLGKEIMMLAVLPCDV